MLPETVNAHGQTALEMAQESIQLVGSSLIGGKRASLSGTNGKGLDRGVASGLLSNLAVVVQVLQNVAISAAEQRQRETDNLDSI